MSSLQAACADNFYHPPEWDPRKESRAEHAEGGRKKLSKEDKWKAHPLRERAKKLATEGILTIRFEMPYNVRCEGCGNHIAKGVRFNAEKKTIGRYLSTKILSFRFLCHCEDGTSRTDWTKNPHYIEIHTDPKNAEYVVAEGAVRVAEPALLTPAELGVEAALDSEEADKRSANPFYRLEAAANAGPIGAAAGAGSNFGRKPTKPGQWLSALQGVRDADWQDDYAANQMLRRAHRSKRKSALLQTAEDESKGIRIPLPQGAARDHPADVAAAREASGVLDEAKRRRGSNERSAPRLNLLTGSIFGGGGGGGFGGQMAEDYRLPGLPRYLRVNTLKIGLGKAKKNLLQTGHHLCPDPKHPGHRAYYRDVDIPDLLVFKPKGQSDISRVPMVESGEVVVQQKASCFPAVALDPPIGGHVIDACAAPGNKTSHVAALMQNKGKVFAFEQNERRAGLLREMMKIKGATIVQTKHMSFLDADPNDPAYANVTHIMLDPSCSSSGMSQTPEEDPERLQGLADDQTTLVLHAMKFPAVVAVCYSTCSVHELENEQVVRRILKGQSAFALAVAMPWWERRGHVLAADTADGKKGQALAEEIGRSVVRTTYPDDQTIGFFLARFERKGSGGGGTGGGGRGVGGGGGASAPDDEAELEDHSAEGAGQSGSLQAKLALLAKARKKEQKKGAGSKPLASSSAQPSKPAQAAPASQPSPSQAQPASEATSAAEPLESDASQKKKRGNSRQRKRQRAADDAEAKSMKHKL